LDAQTRMFTPWSVYWRALSSSPAVTLASVRRSYWSALSVDFLTHRALRRTGELIRFTMKGFSYPTVSPRHRQGSRTRRDREPGCIVQALTRRSQRSGIGSEGVV